MRRLLRWAGRGLLGLLALAALAVVAGWLWLRSSLPDYAGRLQVAGLAAPASVVRDRHAIPHVEAASWPDALFAQGFVHAQDRLWQMEFQRRLGAGRLAEILGPAALPFDRFMRVLGLYRLAEASLAHLRPETRAWLDAYAAGVNAFIAQAGRPLPPEFELLRHVELEPWRPADSLVWIRMLALDLSRNWQDELLRARLAKRLSPEQIADLWPAYPADAPVSVAELTAGLPLDALAAALPPAPPPGQGSNVWAIAGRLSATGAPLLANDPHLGLRAPGTWHLAHLKAPGLELIGAGLPGVPGIVLGHNGTLAWGLTNTGPDTQDLFVERVDPAAPGRYLTPDGSAPFESRVEEIKVAGAASERLTVRSTRHGPVLSDLVPAAAGVLAPSELLALAWTALAVDDRSIETLFGLSRARDFAEVRAAVRDHGAPQQNVVVADRAGQIGFIAPGRVPIRRQGDGRWPVPGWTGEHDWTGMVPFDALPQAQDPPDGRLINANNRVVPPDYPYLLTADWEPPYRARRIAELLAGSGFDLDGFAAIQADQRSLLAVDLLPLMLEAQPSGEAAAKAMAQLAAWDRVMRPNAAEPLLFAAWYRELSRLIQADELGELFTATWSLRPQFIQRVLAERPAWCDDVTTEPVERCPELAARALDLALADLAGRFGQDPAGWRWGAAHPAAMEHPVFTGQPVLGALFDIEVETGGDSTTVNVGHYLIADPARPFASIQAASYRGLYDLADLDRSRFIAATGQSGHPLSSHYRDLTRLWAAGDTVGMSRDPATYGRGALGRLRLQP
jgi:penicillin amidase